MLQFESVSAALKGRHLIHVLAGGLRFGEDPADHFKAGDSLYLLPGNNLTWDIVAGTRLLVSRCDLSIAQGSN